MNICGIPVSSLKINNAFLLVLTIALVFSACKKDDDEPDTTIEFPDEVTVMFENLKPEGIEYNKNKKVFLVGSLTMGNVFEVDFEGNYINFTNDENLKSSAGIHIDYTGDRLLVTNLDPLAFAGGKSVGALNAYRLSTGEKIAEVSLLDILPDASFVTPNDITVDANGNMYITDFLGNAIYKVDANYEASLFSNNPALVGPNGIDFHPAEFLIVSNLFANKIATIALDKPDEINAVTIDDPLFGGFDGMVYKSDGNIVGITNLNPETLIELSSSDNWQSASVINSKTLSSPATTVAVTPEANYYALLTDVVSQEVFTEWVIERVVF